MFSGAYSLSKGEYYIEESNIYKDNICMSVCVITHRQTRTYLVLWEYRKGRADLVWEVREGFSNETVIEPRCKGNIEAHSVTKSLSSLLHKSIFHLDPHYSQVSIKNENNLSSFKKNGRILNMYNSFISLLNNKQNRDRLFPFGFLIDIVKFIKRKK